MAGEDTAVTKHSALITIAIIALFAVLPAPAHASLLTVGLPALTRTGNCDPFGCPAFFGLGTYQQVYAGADFAGPLTINDLAFFDTAVHNGGKPAGGIYTLNFAYTSFDVGNLNLSSPNTNLAGSLQAFFSGALPALSNGTLTFTGTPFFYNPADGNLLLSVTVSGGVNGSPFLYLDQAATNTLTSDAYFGASQGKPVTGGNEAGLVSQFTYTSSSGSGSVPEPGSWLLVCSALTFGSCLAFRRLRVTQ